MKLFVIWNLAIALLVVCTDAQLGFDDDSRYTAGQFDFAMVLPSQGKFAEGLDVKFGRFCARSGFMFAVIHRCQVMSCGPSSRTH